MNILLPSNQNLIEELSVIINGIPVKGETHDFISFWDLNEGSKILSLKTPYLPQDNNPKKKKIITSHFSSFEIIKNDYIVTCWNNNHITNFFDALNNYNLCGKFKCENIVSIIKSSIDGCFLAIVMGTKFQIWQVNTGMLLVNIDHHYQNITCIEFTTDSSYIMSGAEDTLVNVYSMARINSISKDFADKNEPLYTWNDHSLPITDIYVGKLGIGWKSRVLTISADCTCKMYDLSISGHLLCSILYPSPLTKVTCNAMETQIFCGTLSGIIYRTNLVSPKYSSNIHLSAALTSTSKDQKQEEIYEGHTSKIVGLEMVNSTFTLISADTAGFIKMWNTGAFICIKAIDTQTTIIGMKLFARSSEKTKLESLSLDQGKAPQQDVDISQSLNANGASKGKQKSKRHQKYYTLNLPSSSESSNLGTTSAEGCAKKRGGQTKSSLLHSIYLHPNFNNYPPHKQKPDEIREKGDAIIPRTLVVRGNEECLNDNGSSVESRARLETKSLEGEESEIVKLKRENGLLRKANTELYHFNVSKIMNGDCV